MTPEQYAQAKKVFLEAVSMEKEKRQAFVQFSCANDKLVTDEVLGLLAAHEDDPVQDETFSGRSLSVMRSAATSIRTRWSIQTQKISVRIAFILVVIGMILGLGMWTQIEVQRVVNVATAEHLRGALDATVAAFEMWSENRLEIAERIGNQDSVRRAIVEAIEVSRGSEVRGELTPEGKRVVELLKPLAETAGFYSFAVIDRDYVLRVASLPQFIGHSLVAGSTWIGAIVDVFLGKRIFIPPHLHGSSLELRPEFKTLARSVVQFAIPIKNDEGRVIACFVLSMDTDKQFQRLLTDGRAGDSFEMYAFDREATLMSRSRFEEGLRSSGLLQANESSIHKIKLRLPPAEHDVSGEAPLTRLAQTALSAQQTSNSRIGGTLAQPYLDYRGIPVIGVWRWLPSFRMGFAAEADVSEISVPLTYLKISFAILLSLLGLALVSALYAASSMLRLRREIAERKKIGNYRLLKKLGEGGIGEVYLARHDRICRPTAIKILKAQVAAPETILRFEREVQLTCRLTQVNTITIYDFGRTSDGTFYYVMEYLRGVDLGRLLHSEGRLPYGRVVHLLLQTCRSLADAHNNGLIHRDIKPQNIMVSKLGGESDFVKVVDFGLVKDVDDLDNEMQTKVLRGTPLYTAPERFRDPSHTGSVKVDIYSLGATAYKMCSGRNLFSAATEIALINEILSTEPLPLDHVCPDCPRELTQIIMRCVARDPLHRPDSIQEVMEVFSSLQARGIVTWSAEDSEVWWNRHPELLFDASVVLNQA